MADLTPERVAELRAMDQSASPAPWRPCPASGGDCICRLVWAGDRPIVHTDSREKIGTAPSVDGANARLIAAARNELVPLLDEVERLRAELRDIKACDGPIEQAKALRFDYAALKADRDCIEEQLDWVRSENSMLRHAVHMEVTEEGFTYDNALAEALRDLADAEKRAANEAISHQVTAEMLGGATAEVARLRAEVEQLKSHTRPDRVVQHDHGAVGKVTYSNCIGCIADERDALRDRLRRIGQLLTPTKRLHQWSVTDPSGKEVAAALAIAQEGQK